MTITELETLAKNKENVILSARQFLDLLQKAYHVANTEDKVLGGDQKA